MSNLSDSVNEAVKDMQPEFKTRYLVFTQLSPDANFIAHSEVYYTKPGAKYQKQIMQVMGYEQVEIIEINTVN